MNRYSSRSPARSAAGSKATSIGRRAAGTCRRAGRPPTRPPTRRRRSAPSCTGPPRSARRGSNRPGARPGIPRGRGRRRHRRRPPGDSSGFVAAWPCRNESSASAKSRSGSPRDATIGSVQLGNGGLRALVEGLEEAVLEEHVACRPARLARGGGAPREVAVSDRGVDADRAHRACAGRQGQAQGAEKREATALERAPTRSPPGARRCQKTPIPPSGRIDAHGAQNWYAVDMVATWPRDRASASTCSPPVAASRNLLRSSPTLLLLHSAALGGLPASFLASWRPIN